MDHTKLIPGDVWAALAIAAGVLILSVFNRSPLLTFVLVGLGIWAGYYVTMQNRPHGR
jgi:hypothetical protein